MSDSLLDDIEAIEEKFGWLPHVLVRNSLVEVKKNLTNL